MSGLNTLRYLCTYLCLHISPKTKFLLYQSWCSLTLSIITQSSFYQYGTCIYLNIQSCFSGKRNLVCKKSFILHFLLIFSYGISFHMNPLPACTISSGILCIYIQGSFLILEIWYTSVLLQL